MNIFVLDADPRLAAKYHCDKHVVKMVLESAQMLCTAHWVLRLQTLGKSIDDFKRVRDAKQYALENLPAVFIPPYSMSHVRHPCTTWTSSTRGNYNWHVSFMRELLDEYESRYKRQHKCEAVYKWLRLGPPPNIPDLDITPHPQCMPNDCKVPDDTVKAYRNYYIKHKAAIAKWRHGDAPWWWKVV